MLTLSHMLQFMCPLASRYCVSSNSADCAASVRLIVPESVHQCSNCTVVFCARRHAACVTCIPTDHPSVAVNSQTCCPTRRRGLPALGRFLKPPHPPRVLAASLQPPSRCDRRGLPCSLRSAASAAFVVPDRHGTYRCSFRWRRFASGGVR